MFRKRRAYNRRHENSRKSKIKWITIFVFSVAVLGVCVIHEISAFRESREDKPEELITEYMELIGQQKYDAMYAMLDTEGSAYVDKEEFVERNSNIYEGMQTENMQISNIYSDENKDGTISVNYHTAFDTVAGDVEFDNTVEYVHTDDGYRIRWDDSVIMPDLLDTDKVSVTTVKAQRGKILDRNGVVLAGKGTASSVGIVPGKLDNKKKSIRKIAKLLNMDVKTIKNKLAATWVKEDSFVPVATIDKVDELKLLADNVSKKIVKEHERQQKLLDINGVSITDVEVRSYKLGEAASHLIGYVQSITAEDLEEHEGEGYSSDSVIGRSGAESLYESRLKGQNGCTISIVDKEGNTKENVATVSKVDGEDIKLTIDATLQRNLYKQFKKDQGCSVALNQYTGEVLALVSTPSYDDNDFIMGMSSDEWTSLNDDKDKPLYNRFRQIWCPGSTFKPVISLIGLKTGDLDPDEDFGSEGLSWQKDASWGSYHVTTLHTYTPVIMKNALIYSDNIYFAKVALKIGSKKLMKSLDDIGFNAELPFDITMSQSQYSNTDKIETQIQLADSGYGQGEILVNPLHLASIYTAFSNNGNILKPYLEYSDSAAKTVWLKNAFTKSDVKKVMEGLKGVVNNPHGTGYAAHRSDMILAGKTGTAEHKATQEDTSGTETGWFSVFTTEKNAQKPVLIVSMVENVKDIGGSGYVVRGDKAVLDKYLR